MARVPGASVSVGSTGRDSLGGGGVPSQPPPTPITVAITSPAPSASLPQNVLVSIAIATNVPGVVTIKEGTTVLGTVTTTTGSLTGIISWTPAFPDMGSQTLNASAVATAGGSTADAPGVSVTVTLPLILTQTGGAQLYWDALHFASTPTDGAAIPALANLSGSNAAFDTANDFGHGATALPTYRAAGWLGQQPAVELVGTKMGWIGSDIAGCISGVGKLWHVFFVFEPMFLAGVTNIPGGWTGAAGTQFASGMLTWTTGATTAGQAPVSMLQGPTANVADAQQYGWEPMIFEMWRPDATHVQLSYNGEDSAPIAYANGTSFAVDRFVHGCWNNVSNDGIASTEKIIATVAYNLLPNRTAVRNALKERYFGFDYQKGLGAP